MRLIELETTSIHDAIRYHITNNIPFRENIFRPGSENFFKLFNEARKMYEKGLLNVDVQVVLYINIKLCLLLKVKELH